MSKPILIFGHQNPDTDSICSAIAFAELQRLVGNEAEAIRLGEVRPEPAFALEYFKVPAPRLIEGDISKETDYVMLVDHNEFSQSAKGIENVTIEAVVDHHRINDFKTASPLYYRAEPVGCTCTILYKLYLEADKVPSPAIAGLMMSAIISDTLLFQSPTCTEIDRIAAKSLSAIADVPLESYGKELLKAGASIKGKTPEELLQQDCKPFHLGNLNLKVAQVNVIGFDEALEIREELLATMEKERSSEDFDTYLLLITDIFENNSIGLVVGDEGIINASFEGSTVNEDKIIDLPGVVSRKKQVVPPLTNTADQLK